MPCIHLAQPQSFREEVATEKKLVLLLCMPHDDAFQEQIRTVEELAGMFQLEKNNVAVRLHRIRQRLQAEMQR